MTKNSEKIQVVDKRSAPKSDEVEVHNAQQVKLNPAKMGFGDLVDELIEIPHGVYHHQAFGKRRQLIKDELNKRGRKLETKK